MLARLAPDAVLARVFGVLESLVALSTGVGAVVASLVIAEYGVRTALVVIGLVCPIAAAASWRRLRRMDRSIDVLDHEIGLLQAVSMLNLLPLPAIEQLARGLEPIAVPAGRHVFDQGDVGDRYFVIESGEAEVVGDGHVVATLGPGEGFGEIALLRRTRRTATVRAGSDLRLHTLRSDHFLPVVLGFTPSAREAGTVVDTMLGRFAPHDPLDPEPGQPEDPCRVPDMASERSLLLIADIGGYTDYMSTHRMSLAHAEVNTGRLLEKVVDAAPGFELVEIEGDAAFLSRAAGADDQTTVELTLKTAMAMHRAFHLERQYVAANLCPCNGCAQANNLKLKFVAHVGEVATQTIQEAAQAGRDRRHPGPPVAEEPGRRPRVRPAHRRAVQRRRRHGARPLTRGVAGRRGDRTGPLALRRRRGSGRHTASAARPHPARAAGQDARGGRLRPALHARPPASAQRRRLAPPLRPRPSWRAGCPT